MANLQIDRENKKTTLLKFLKRHSNLILIVVAMLFCIPLIYFLVQKNDWKVPENWDFTLIIQAGASMLAGFLAMACIDVFVRLFLRWKIKKENGQSSFDEEYLQEYIRVVGTYLGAVGDEKLSLYKSVAADIYRHIPRKYWELVDEIDDDVSKGDRSAAWKDLKRFIKLIAQIEETK